MSNGKRTELYRQVEIMWQLDQNCPVSVLDITCEQKLLLIK